MSKTTLKVMAYYAAAFLLLPTSMFMLLVSYIHLIAGYFMYALLGCALSFGCMLTSMFLLNEADSVRRQARGEDVEERDEDTGDV